MELKEKDFVKVDYDMFANGDLVHTTSEVVAKKYNFTAQKKFGAESFILGKGFVLKAFDDAIFASKGLKNKIVLSAENAYGIKKTDLIKTFTKTAFDEQKLKAVPGMAYDFNGMLGIVRSVTGGRILVDFNHPLSGKEITIEYEVKGKIESIVDKLTLIMEKLLRVPSAMFSITAKDKTVTLKVPEQFVPMKEMLLKAFEELISDIKSYTLVVEGQKVVSKK